MTLVPIHDLAWLRSKTDPTDAGCWEWRGSKTSVNASGQQYGVSYFRGEIVKAHRLAFFIQHGHWPKICRHTCDNPPCCNPDHLVDGTRADNTRDRDARHRGRWPQGQTHASARLTDAQVAEMRALYATGEWTQGALARRFKVGQSQVHRIVRNHVRTP